jgi:rubrerythrin
MRIWLCPRLIAVVWRSTVRKGIAMKRDQLVELLLQSLEHEKGGVEVYQNAVECAVREDLKEEWEKYLTETLTHVQILEQVCDAFGVDPETRSPGRDVVRTVGAALVEAMRKAAAGGDPSAAQLVACECVVLAETKDHLDWELLGKCAEKLSGDERKALAAAVEEVEDQEDEHLYHTKGWCRELWIESLGMRAVLPPPEEEHDVKTAIGAARAEKASEKARRR